MASLKWGLVVIALQVGFPQTAAAEPPSYLFAVQQELSRMGIEARCEEKTGTCRFVHGSTDGKSTRPVLITARRDTATVSISFERFFPLESNAGPSLDLSRRMLAINRDLISGRLEWDSVNSTIRLSAVLNTDSNFDRQAFRSVLKGLFSAAERILPELQKIERATAASH